jgi:hypothetical protein
MGHAHITITSPEYRESLEEMAAQGESDWWTCNRQVRCHDRIFLYMTAPDSAIVAIGYAASDARFNDKPQSMWHGHHIADIEGLTMLNRPVSRKELLERFPAWGYWKMPRLSVRVPDKFQAEFEGFISVHQLAKHKCQAEDCEEITCWCGATGTYEQLFSDEYEYLDKTVADSVS